MKYVALIFSSLLSLSVSAESVLFSGNQVSTCTLTKTQDGALTFDSATAFSTVGAYKGEITIENNDAGAFNVTASVPTDWSFKPAGYTGTTTFDSGFDMTGANAALDSNSTLLNNSGTDSLSLSIDGTSDTDYPAGTYQTTVTVTCAAI